MAGRKKSKQHRSYDLDLIRQAARGRWPEILSSLGGISRDVLDGNHHECPKCGGTDRFRLIDATAGACLCNQCYREKNGDGFAVLQWLIGIGFKLSMERVAGYLGIEPTLNGHSKSGHGHGPNDSEPTDPAAHLDFLPWNESADRLAALWCLQKPGILPAAIHACHGRIARYRKQYTVVALPIWGEQLNSKSSAPVGWVIYNVTGGTLPKFSKGKPVEQIKVKVTAGSKPGLIGPVERLTFTAKPDIATTHTIKVEGPTDLLALLSLPDLPAYFTAITNANGAGEKPAAWMLGYFAGHDCVFVHDADIPGKSGAERWATFAAEVAKSSTWLTVPYPIEPSHGQDLRDWLNEGHGWADVLELVATAGQQVDNASTPPTNTTPGTSKNPAKTSINGRSTTSPGTTPPPTDSPPAAAGITTNGPRPLEADDDPHRLARVNLARYADHADGGTIRFWRDEWYTWKPSRGCYRKIAENELRAKLTTSIKEEFDRLNIEYQQARAEQTKNSDDDSTPKRTQKVTKALVSNVLAATAGLTTIPYSVEPMTWLDPNAADPLGDSPYPTTTRRRRNLVAMLNALIDVDALLADADESECILPHSPRWFSTIRLPYAFDANAKCPRWEAFLERNLELDPERIKIVQEWAGYLLTPDTGQQKFLAMEGEGANGKSVFMAALSAMLGAENCSHIGLESLGPDFDRAETIGKLVNICADVGEVDRIAEGGIKSFTSGDVVFFKRKNISGVSCLPTARLMLSFNNRPRFSDRSSAIWRRMMLIPWNVTIAPHERIPNMDKSWWWEKEGELPGIFNWALMGLARLRAQGRFTDSRLAAEANDDYRDESNPARLFLKDHFEQSDSAVRCSTVYHFYCRWCDATGHRPLADGIFGREVKRAFPGTERKRNRINRELKWTYSGISFATDEICGERVDDGTLF